MPSDGTCRDCGTQIAPPQAEGEVAKAPWHFWLLVVLATAYIGWRILQLVGVLS
jgi:hypothetical protein